MVGFGLGALLRHTAAALSAVFALATLNPPTGPHAARVPSLSFALFDLALYLVVFVGAGAWRARRDA